MLVYQRVLWILKDTVITHNSIFFSDGRDIAIQNWDISLVYGVYINNTGKIRTTRMYSEISEI